MASKVSQPHSPGRHGWVGQSPKLCLSRSSPDDSCHVLPARTLGGWEEGQWQAEAFPWVRPPPLPFLSSPVSSVSSSFTSLSPLSSVRRPAPQFTAKALVNGEFKQICSADLKDKYWILFFYPLDLYSHMAGGRGVSDPLPCHQLC